MESSLYMHYMEVCANSGASVKRSELADANERKKGEQRAAEREGTAKRHASSSSSSSKLVMKRINKYRRCELLRCVQDGCQVGLLRRPRRPADARPSPRRASILEGSNHCREWLVEEAVRHVTGGAGGGQVGKGDGRASARKREVGWCGYCSARYARAAPVLTIL